MVHGLNQYIRRLFELLNKKEVHYLDAISVDPEFAKWLFEVAAKAHAHYQLPTEDKKLLRDE